MPGQRAVCVVCGALVFLPTTAGVPAEDLRWHLWKIGVKDMVTQARSVCDYPLTTV